VLLHNALAFGNGYGLARLFGLKRKETKTITLETGIQNSGLGLLLIFLFFDGLGSMALITAFWGIWHLISGTGLALLWSRAKEDSGL
jgi:BASS family bile acid:Na+ symporter